MLLVMAVILGWLALSALAVVLCAAARRGDRELALVVTHDDADRSSALRRAL